MRWAAPWRTQWVALDHEVPRLCFGLVSTPAGALTAVRNSHTIVATSSSNQRRPLSSAGVAAGRERLTSEPKLRDGHSRNLDDQQPGTCPQFRQSAYDRTFLPRQQYFRKSFSLRDGSQLRARGTVVTSVDSKRALVRRSCKKAHIVCSKIERHANKAPPGASRPILAHAAYPGVNRRPCLGR
jgi:hypothetical protein